MRKDVVEVRDRRYSILKAGGAYVEFSCPGPTGGTFRLPILELSASGLSFALGQLLPSIARDTVLEHVTVCVADCEMRGRLMVKHLTVVGRGEAACGAVFYPSTEADLLKLNAIISGITTQST